MKEMSIQASALNLVQETPAEQAKNNGMRKAQKLVKQQFQSDEKFTAGLEKCRKTIRQQKEIQQRAAKEMQSLSKEQEKLKEVYGIEDGSQEQEDLELRLKIQKASKPNSNVRLTKEDIEKMKELGPLTDYQKQYMDWENEKSSWMEEWEDAKEIIGANTRAITASKIEFDKTHGMVDALAAAEDIQNMAGEEAINAMVRESIEHIKEQIEEAKEKGEEVDADEIEARVEEILQKQKLLEEDLKGIQVNSAV